MSTGLLPDKPELCNVQHHAGDRDSGIQHGGITRSCREFPLPPYPRRAQCDWNLLTADLPVDLELHFGNARKKSSVSIFTVEGDFDFLT